MNDLAVVFVAFDGVQPIDVVGPHEVFANAGDAAASLGRRARYRVRVASALAAAASMSVRHFTRVFTTEVGQSPGRFVERVRLEAARADLEAGHDTLHVVAERCGLGSAESLRRVFLRHLGVSPDAYRRRFRTTTRGGAAATRHEGASA